MADRAAEAAGELAEVELDDEIRDFHLAQQHACESVALAIRSLAARAWSPASPSSSGSPPPPWRPGSRRLRCTPS